MVAGTNEWGTAVETGTVGEAGQVTDARLAAALPDPDSRRWTLSDLQWLLDGEWEVRAVADRIVASRDHVAVVVDRRRGVYCATTKLSGIEYNHHQSVTLPGALAGVRRDLRREGR